MAKFKLAWHELHAFEAEVEAESLDAAIELFKQGEIEFPEKGQYVDGSTELNRSFTEFLNSEEGKCQSSATN
jgi:hypothetical protein